MSKLYWLTDAQMERLRPFFPKSRGKPRVDDRRVLSGIIYIQRNGLMWNHAPAAYGPPKTLYNRWKRWSRMGVFATIMTELAAQAQDTEMVMIDATGVKSCTVRSITHATHTVCATGSPGDSMAGCMPVTGSITNQRFPAKMVTK